MDIIQYLIKFESMAEMNQDTWEDPQFPLPLTSPLSRSGHQHSSVIEQKITNLHELFSSSAYKDCIKNQECEAISSIIHSNPQLYHDLLDTMLCIQNPRLSNLFKENYTESEINNLPYQSFQLLNSMSEGEAMYLMGEESKSEQEIQSANSILKHYYSVFKEKELNETAAGYVLRINETVLMRESSFPLYEWLNSHEEVLGNILEHFDSCSATSLILRLLDLDVENVPIEQRTNMIQKIFQKVTDLTLLLNKPKLIQGLKQFIDEQFQRAMNSENAETLTNQVITPENISRLIELFQSSHMTTTYLLQILISIFNHYKKEEPKPEKENSRHYMGYRPPPQIYMSPVIFQQLVRVVSKTYLYVKEEEERNTSGFIKSYYFRYLEVLGYLGKYYPESVVGIVSVGMVNDLLSVIKKYPRNNLVHISVKEFLVSVIKCGKREEVVYQKECGLVDFVFRGMVEETGYYQQHLFEIMRQLVEDEQFESESKGLSEVSFGSVFSKYEVFLNNLPKPEADNDTEEHGEESQIEDLADFDPTKNIDDLSPYYYQEMVIDEDYEKEGERRGSYSWKDGKMNGGVLARNITVQIEEVESPVIYRFGEEGETERDRERMWGLKIPNLLDSDGEENLVSRKKSSKTKEIDSFDEKQQTSKLEMSDERRQQSMESQIKDPSAEQKESEGEDDANGNTLILSSSQTESKIESRPEAALNPIPCTALNPINEEKATSETSSHTNPTWTQRITRTIIKPFTWMAEFIWDIS